MTQISNALGKGDPRTYAIIGAAMEVHRELGQGFLDAVYQEALALELSSREIPFAREATIPVYYKGQALAVAYRADFICYGDVLVELKAIKTLTDVERAQLLHYLKATGFEVGLLINFGAKSLAHERFANSRSKSV